MKLTPKIEELSEAEQEQALQWLDQLEEGWAPGRLDQVIGELPAEENGLRQCALFELVKLDLQYQWHRGARRRVEDYLERFPELLTFDLAPLMRLETDLELRKGQPNAESFNPDATVEAPEDQTFDPDSTLEAPNEPAAAESPKEPDVPFDPDGTVEEEIEVKFPALPAREMVLDLPGEEAPAGETPRSKGTILPDGANPRTHRAGPQAKVGPEQIGRYQIIRTLGKGGMGAVYLAHDPQLEREVALKIPFKPNDDDGEILVRFRREAQAAAVLRHPNICPVFDVGEVDGLPFLTMAFIEGQPLSSFMRDGQTVPSRRAATLAAGIARGMEEAHQHNVIHRDLKPANVLIDKRGEPIIMDFGLARRLNRPGSELTEAGRMLGTPEYMAPEQVLGDLTAIGPATDIYSLGVILYKMLTGHTPFEGTIGEIIARILAAPPKPPSRLKEDLDPRIEAICMKALSRAITDRYPSMAAFAEVLDEYARSSPTAPAPPPEAPPPPPDYLVTQQVAAPVLVPPAAPLPLVSHSAPEVESRSAPEVEPPPASAAVSRSTPMALNSTPANRSPFSATDVSASKASSSPVSGRSIEPRLPPSRTEAAPIKRHWQIASLVVPLGLLLVGSVAVGYFAVRALRPHPPATGTPPVVVAPSTPGPAPSVPVVVNPSIAELARQHYDRGMAAFDQKHFTTARDELEQSIKLAPSPEAHFQLGRLQALEGESRAAIASFTASLSLDPKAGAVRAARGWSYLDLKNYSAARKDFTGAIELDPTLADAYHGRAMIFMAENRLAPALEDLRDARFLDGNQPLVLVHMGDLFRARREYDQALDFYTLAWKMAPQLQAVQQGMDVGSQALCDSYLNVPVALRDWDKAIADFTERIRKDRDNPWALRCRGQLYQRHAELDRALADFNEAIRLNTNDARAYRHRGDLYATRKKYKDACDDFSRAIDLTPSDYRAWSARAHAELGRRDESQYRAQCEAALQEFGKTDDSSAANTIAYMCSIRPRAVEHPREVVDLARRAVDQDQNNYVYLSTLGATLYRLGEFESAASSLKDAVQRRNGEGIVNDWAFQALTAFQLNRNVEGRTRLEKVRGWLKDNTPPAQGDPPIGSAPWTQRLAIELLAQEAEQAKPK